MNKKFRKAASVALAAMMCMAMTVPVSAADDGYTLDTTDNTKTITTFNKHLIMDKNANIPNVKFEFTVTAGDKIEAADGVFPVTPGILEGLKLINPTTKDEVSVNNPNDAKITVKFGTATEGVVNTAVNTKNENVTGFESEDSDTQKYATGQITLDFSGVAFPEPGVYRYVINETKDDVKGIKYDESTLYLDVYVEDITEDNENAPLKLAIMGYTLSTEANNLITNDNNGTKENNYGNKSDGFENEYTTYDLTFKKEVTGNQASKDKYFKFTVTVYGLNEGDKFTVNISDAEAEPTANDATNTSYTDMRNKEEITVEEGTSFQRDFYLHHGQSITIEELPAGATWTITEDAEDYKASYAVTEGNEGDMDGSNGTTNTVSDNGSNGIEGDTKVIFTNTRSGTVPTGILMTVAPFAGLMVVGIAGAAVILNKKKKND